MSISALAADERVTGVEVTEDELTVHLIDGRAISVPLVWYPRLLNATPEQRKNWCISGGGYGIHWEDIDEDLSARGLLLGIPASQQSAMQVFQAREYAYPVSQDTAEGYPKGMLDYLVEVENAGKELVSILSLIGTQFVNITGKIEQRIVSIGSVTSSPAGTTANDVNKVALLLAYDLTEFAKGIEESTQRFSRNTNILENGLLAYIALLKPEDRGNIEQLGSVKDSLSTILNTAREIKGSIASVADTVRAVSDQKISYAITKAINKQGDALNGLMESINEFETFALKIDFQIDEKLSQA
jgi:hypothetical protein